METAQQVINDALQEILVQASEQPIQAVDFQTARRYLNRMMATVPFNGLGYTTITELLDLVTVPDAALEGIVSNLAKKLLTTYGVILTAELLMNAKEGLNEIRRLTVRILPTNMPCTLPIGSGNEDESTYNNNHFYACPDDEIEAEQNGSILLESNTND